MAYTKTEWHTGDPITQNRMNHIEDGIAAAQSTADNAIKPTDSSYTNLVNDVSGLKGVVGENDSQGLRRAIIDLGTEVSQVAGDNSPGVKAWTQVVGATDANASRQTAYDNLDSRFNAIERTVATEQGLRIANTTQITGAMRTGSDSLVQRFQDVEGSVSSVSGALNTLNTTLDIAKGNDASLAARLNHLDGGSVPSRTLPNVIEE